MLNSEITSKSFVSVHLRKQIYEKIMDIKKNPHAMVCSSSTAQMVNVFLKLLSVFFTKLVQNQNKIFWAGRKRVKNKCFHCLFLQGISFSFQFIFSAMYGA